MFPAHAGMNRLKLTGHIELKNVPRTRGDEPQSANIISGHIECSPHTRG